MCAVLAGLKQMGNGFAEATVAATVEHYTPWEIFEALGEQFDLDPCYPENPPAAVRVPATYVLTKATDGLATPWPAEMFVWCNPPYGREASDWLAKMAAHGNGIALVFARTGTKWFHNHAVTADAICFMQGRIRFIDENGVQQDPAKADSILIGWGPRAVAALKRSKLGAMMVFDRTPARPYPPVVTDLTIMCDACGGVVESDFTTFCDPCRAQVP